MVGEQRTFDISLSVLSLTIRYRSMSDKWYRSIYLFCLSNNFDTAYSIQNSNSCIIIEAVERVLRTKIWNPYFIALWFWTMTVTVNWYGLSRSNDKKIDFKYALRFILFTFCRHPANGTSQSPFSLTYPFSSAVCSFRLLDCSPPISHETSIRHFLLSFHEYL